MKIVCISDTHLQHRWNKIDVPDGDVLIHAGDGLSSGRYSELQIFQDWFLAFPHKHKIFVPGNHDWCFQTMFTAAAMGFPIVLCDSGIEIEGLKFWGSPWQPEFYNWAFNLPRGQALKAKWDLIPNDTDVLITHGPPHGILDRTDRGEHVGCEDLTEALVRVRPKLHVFGHIHHGAGQFDSGSTIFVNASICDERYNPVNPPIAVDLVTSNSPILEMVSQ